MKSQRHRWSISVNSAHYEDSDVNRVILVKKRTPKDVRILVPHGPDGDFAIKHSSGSGFFDQFISEDPAPAIRNDRKDFIILQYVPSRKVHALSDVKGRPNSLVT
ncbi:hypothetical protein EKH55_5708 (plasmid) [Sinorhizobium alkalisoli]|nr:hypothetical protein EKH55_5708 [Sinorhizobium alkalisoli]